MSGFVEKAILREVGDELRKFYLKLWVTENAKVSANSVVKQDPPQPESHS